MRPETVLRPPFWGSRTIETLPLASVFERLDVKQLFRLSWGAKSTAGAEWEALERELTLRLQRMKKEALAGAWFAPKAVYGYFPARSDGNDVVIFDPVNHERVLERLVFPRQQSGDRMCVADYFAPMGFAEPDVAAIQVVTIGSGATERFEAMDGQAQYSEAYFLHGLAVQTAEATAELVFERVRQELGLEEGRGKRYSWGFAGMSDVEEHRKVFALLPAEKDLGMSLTSAGQLIPEQSTAALIVHHRDAKYFKV
jgi:5-methyltetrahydrofolate--homocysteine methyltransferase